MAIDLSGGVEAFVEGAVKDAVGTLFPISKLPADLQGPANAALAADEAFAIAVAKHYAVAAVGKAAPSLLPALKAAFPGAGL